MHLLSKIGLAAVAVVICGLFIQAIQSPDELPANPHRNRCN